MTTGWAKKCTGANSATSRMMPSAPKMDRPPMMAGRLAATTPPKTKNSRTATSGMAATSARCWSSPMVPVSSAANGCRPASLTLTPLTKKSSLTSLKLFRIVSSSLPLSWIDMNACFLSASAMFDSSSGLLK